MCLTSQDIRRAGPEPLAAVAVAALGGCHADHLEALAEELAPLLQEFNGERAKARPCAPFRLLVCLLCQALASKEGGGCAQTGRGRSRREEVRLAAAQVARLAAEGLPPGALRESAALRAHFLVFMDDTRTLLASGAHGAPLLLSKAYMLSCSFFKSCQWRILHS